MVPIIAGCQRLGTPMTFNPFRVTPMTRTPRYRSPDPAFALHKTRAAQDRCGNGVELPADANDGIRSLDASGQNDSPNRGQHTGDDVDHPLPSDDIDT